MKISRVIMILVCITVLCFALAASGYAIGFSAQEAYNSIFVVYSGNSMGSGFAIGQNCIVTNAHVIDNRRDVVIQTYSGEQYAAVIAGIDEMQDIAVLCVPDKSFPYLPVKDEGQIKEGDDVYAIGAPKSMSYTLTKGIISAKERYVSGNWYIQTDAAINEGNSGGPLLSDEGAVIGVNTLKISDSEGIGLAIPVSRICAFLEKLGFELDDTGNVEGSVEIEDNGHGTVVVPETEEENKNNDGENGLLTLVLLIIAVFSVAGNVVLSVLLISQRKKKSVITYDPTERTDFEIDVWD